MSQTQSSAWAPHEAASNLRRVAVPQAMARWFGSALMLATLWIAGARPALAAEPPNIVFMLSDDQGWSGLSVAMHPDVPGSRGEVFHTPALEQLAA